MRFLNRALRVALRDLLTLETQQSAAALSFYLILSVFPFLIFLSAILGFLPLPHLFGTVLVSMARILPSETMRMIYSVLADVLSPNRITWLSVGMLGTIWVTTSAFSATIETLNRAYGVVNTRSYWRTRLLATELVLITSILLLCALLVAIAGPKIGHWLAGTLFSTAFVTWVWLIFRWIIALTFTVFAVAITYFLSPLVRQRFWTTLPGAVLTVTFCIGLSYLLGIYFRHFADYNQTYGTLGGFVAFMIWFYWTSLIFIAGANLNAELLKRVERGPERKHQKDL